jgi:hypothetical protein
MTWDTQEIVDQVVMYIMNGGLCLAETTVHQAFTTEQALCYSEHYPIGCQHGTMEQTIGQQWSRHQHQQMLSMAGGVIGVRMAHVQSIAVVE